MKLETKDAYDVLGVTPASDPEEIKKAYRRLCKRVHADAGGTDTLFRIVNESYQMVKDNPAASGAQTRASQETYQTRTQANQQQTHTNRAQTQGHTQGAESSGNYDTWEEATQKSWRDIIIAKDFIVPFELIQTITTTFQSRIMKYRNQNIELSMNTLRNYPVKSSFPIVISIKTWKTRFHKWFGMQPLESARETMECRNLAFRDNCPGATFQYRSNLTIKVKKGYHEARISFLGETARFLAKTKTQSEKNTQQIVIDPTGDRILSITMIMNFVQR